LLAISQLDTTAQQQAATGGKHNATASTVAATVVETLPATPTATNTNTNTTVISIAPPTV